MRIENVAPADAEDFQGSRKNAEVVEILGGVNQYFHQPLSNGRRGPFGSCTGDRGRSRPLNASRTV